MKINSKTLIRSGLLTASMTLATSAFSADGCKFLLCMGAPNPMGISECAGTVKEVLRDLRKGKGLPHCSLSNGQDSKSEGSYVAYRRATLVPTCPKGYRQGSDSVIYHVGKKPNNARNNTRYSGGVISDYSKKYIGFPYFGDGYKARACIAGASNGSIPSYFYTTRVSGELERVRVPKQEWVDKAVLMTPDGASYEFTMFTDGKPFSQHRF